MSVLRANVEATKTFIRARVGNPYVYGGALSNNVRQGTDCSEVWQTVLEMVHGRWVPGRQSEGATTESYRYIPVGGVGPFGTIRVNHWRDIPADAAARLAFHHGPGGGANSHMWGDLEGMRIESAGSKGLVTGNNARAVEDGYGHAWAYLPGPIIDDGTPIPPAPPEVVLLGRRFENSGDRVKRLQEALNSKGARLEVDGDFGPLTEAAVSTYQRANGLEIDGVAGPETLTHLGLTFTPTPTPRPVSGGLSVETLARIMDHRVPLQRYVELLPHVVKALDLADCNTVDRRAMWFAQVGHESGGLKYQEEIASGAAYEGRCSDLGNCQPGDGVRFKGRDFIQITGRSNYTKLSVWAHGKGLVPTPTFFVDHPEKLATDAYAFIGVTWYWTVARPMNSYADRRDLLGATKAVNGGTNGLDDRREFYARALSAGDNLLNPADELEALLMSNEPRPSMSHYRKDNNPVLTPLDAIYQTNAMRHEEMVEAAALRGEAWAIRDVADLATGKGPGAQDNDGPFWVERARHIIRTIQTAIDAQNGQS